MTIAPSSVRTHPALLAAASLLITLACGTDRSVGPSATDEKPVVSATPAELTLTVGQSADLTGSIRNSAGQVFGPESNTQWTWFTSATSIIKLEHISLGRARVTGLAEGDATVSVSTIGNTPGFVSVHVVKNPTFVASVRIGQSSADLEIGETLQPTCTAFDALGAVITDVAFTWSSTAPGVASATSGIITGLTPGQAIARCTVTNGTASAAMVVTVHGFELTITPTSASIPIGGTTTLNVSIRTWRGLESPLGNRTLSWESNATSRATVAGNGSVVSSTGVLHRGLVTGVAEGPATITATLSGVGGGAVTAAITVRAVTAADLVGTYTKNGIRQAPGCNPSAFDGGFLATLRVIADASNPAGIRLEEVHPTVTLPWSFLTITSIPGGLRISTGVPVRTIGGSDYETYLEIDIVNGQITGRETFRKVGTTCLETYAVTGSKQ